MSKNVRRSLAAVAAAGLALSLATAAVAAPAAKLKQFRLPSAGASPEYIIQASDGNFWFTESFVNDQGVQTHNVGRITPTGAVTEFPVCDFCFPTDITQGSDGLLYFIRNDAPAGVVNLQGEVQPEVGDIFQFNGGGLDAHADDIWITDFNNDKVWRYDIPTDQLTDFAVPGSTPFDVAVDDAGIVWFTASDDLTGVGQIGRLDPNAPLSETNPTMVDVDGFPRDITIASDGFVWFTERFVPQGVGRLDPATLTAQVFPLDGGPQGIASAAGGSVWVTRTTAGNVVRIAPDGAVTLASKAVKGSEPFGITVADNGDPWFAMTSADKIGHLVLQ